MFVGETIQDIICSLDLLFSSPIRKGLVSIDIQTVCLEMMKKQPLLPIHSLEAHDSDTDATEEEERTSPHVALASQTPCENTLGSTQKNSRPRSKPSPAKASTAVASKTVVFSASVGPIPTESLDPISQPAPLSQPAPMDPELEELWNEIRPKMEKVFSSYKRKAETHDRAQDEIKLVRSQLEQTRSELDQVRTDLDQTRTDLDRVQAAKNLCDKSLAKTKAALMAALEDGDH